MTKPACFSTKIPKTKYIPLKDLLLEQGFTLSIPQYTEFQGKKDGISVTLYSSGKLTVQGKAKDEFIEFYLEPQILESVEYTHASSLIDKTARIGVDEAGKGDFFGPLCTAAVYADEEIINGLVALGIQDSKRIADTRIHKIAPKIKEICPHEILILKPEKYNELYDKFYNLNRLLAWCHATVIESVHTKTGCTFATIDQFGDERLVLTALNKKNDGIKLQQQHKGEEDIVIAAASVLARHAFITSMKKASDHLGIELPKGASAQVKAVARQLANKDPALLRQVCKTHFKTYSEVL